MDTQRPGFNIQAYQERTSLSDPELRRKLVKVLHMKLENFVKLDLQKKVLQYHETFDINTLFGEIDIEN